MQSLTDVDWSVLPPPHDDGRAAHLTGKRFPRLSIRSTSAESINIGALRGTTVLFVFPRIRSGNRPPSEKWEKTPGAKGCTPQACSFRDMYEVLRSRGVDHLYGLSAQPAAEQEEAVHRLHLPYDLLSDEKLRLAGTLRLPTFTFEGVRLFSRLTLIIRDGFIRHVFYPVFPPDANPQSVAQWLHEHASRLTRADDLSMSG